MMWQSFKSKAVHLHAQASTGTFLSTDSVFVFLHDPECTRPITNRTINQSTPMFVSLRRAACGAAVPRLCRGLSDSTAAAAAAAAVQPEGRMTVLFGSTTGTAQWFAELVRRGVTQGLPGLHAEVRDPEEYDADELCEEDIVVFVMANYGKGDPTVTHFQYTLKLRD